VGAADNGAMRISTDPDTDGDISCLAFLPAHKTPTKNRKAVRQLAAKIERSMRSRSLCSGAKSRLIVKTARSEPMNSAGNAVRNTYEFRNSKAGQSPF